MISLFGYGKTTKALSKRVGSYRFYDDNITEIVQKEGEKIYPSTLFDPDKSSLEIPSPGIPPSSPLIKKAKNLVSDYDYLLGNKKEFSIWISGTNGKTTVTKMIGHLLKDKGAKIGGNVGTPLASLEKAPIYVLETSSFTLHYTNIAKPDIYILLPVSEDHIDWHGSFEAYKEAKLKPLKLMKEGEAILLPKEFENVQTNGYKIPYQDSKDLANFFDIDTNRIDFKEPFLLDALLALGVSKILFDEVDYDLINSFRIDPHRVEEFYDSKDRLWVDDSKGTNLHATINALKRYKDKKIRVILGGDDKGANLQPLFDFLKGLDVSIYAIGSNKEKIAKLSKEIKKEFFICKDLNDAVMHISKVLDKNEIALLSPAASSLDEFNSYKERGELFKKSVMSI